MKIKPDTYKQMKAEMLTEFNSHKRELKTALLSATDYQASKCLWQGVWMDKLHDDSHPRFSQEHGDIRIHPCLGVYGDVTYVMYPDGTNDSTLATALKKLFAEIRQEVLCQV